MASSIFHHPHRVTYAECTLGNHVYYARYLDLLEAARGELFRTAGLPLPRLQADGILLPVIECHLRYRAPARHDDLLDIAVWITELGGVRLHFGSRIANQNASAILEAETHHVCTGLGEKPRRLPGDIMEKLRPWLKPAP